MSSTPYMCLIQCFLQQKKKLRGALSSLLEFWSTVLLPLVELCQLAGAAVLTVISKVFCLALANQGVQEPRRANPLRDPRRKAAERDLTAKCVAVHKKRSQNIEPADIIPGKQLLVGKRPAPHKRLRDQADLLSLGRDAPKQKRACVIRRHMWCFRLPSSDDIENELWEKPVTSPMVRPGKNHTKVMDPLSTHFPCELRPWERASSELRSRDGASLAPVGEGNAMAAVAGQVRRQIGHWKPVFYWLVRPRSRKPRGMPAGLRVYRENVGSTPDCIGIQDLLLHGICWPVGLSTRSLEPFKSGSFPLQFELSVPLGYASRFAFIKNPLAIIPHQLKCGKERRTLRRLAAIPNARNCSGKWTLSSVEIIVHIWRDGFCTMKLYFLFSSYPWVPIRPPLGNIDAGDIDFLSLFQSITMAHITRDQVVEFSLVEVQSDRACAAKMLIGRVFSEERLTVVELRSAINNPWQGHGRIKVREVSYGLYEFTLPSKAAKNWVLQRTPWVLKDKILHLRTWVPNITSRIFEEMVVAPFRVQMWEVPEDCCTQQFGHKMASSTLGRVLEAGVFTCNDNVNTFIKVKALIDFSKPLRSQTMATNEETGEFWIRFKYEHLPSFCYNCGRVGHFRQDCSFDPSTMKERFGPHMTTKKMGR
ncbi:unnamed protein product [Linum trigynum]|uniref:CCHC-type domain-containing protein n=1 Tax=Linum trigynum TaxID=586398 RepID=A0AAV2DYR6_9ROSI